MVAVAFAGLVMSAAGCGQDESSTPVVDQTVGGPPIAGEPCATADMVVHDDTTDSDLLCRVGDGGSLVWVVEPKSGGATTSPSGESSEQMGLSSSAEIPAVMENFGFDLAPFDPASGMAGAMAIAGVVPPTLPDTDPNKVAIDARNRFLFLPFGHEAADRTDPQWSFFLPLGTPVVSLVTGTVCDMPQLSSNDHSIRVAPDGVACDAPGRAAVMFETEHVIDPLVAVGDHVMAGQHIATVSDYQTIWADAGFGIVEIGVAYSIEGDSSPWHACPSRFFAPALAQAMRATIESLMGAWSAELGEPGLYDAARSPEPGCFVADVQA